MIKHIPKQCLNCGHSLHYGNVKAQIQNTEGNIIAGTCPKCGATYDRRSVFRQHNRYPRKRV